MVLALLYHVGVPIRLLGVAVFHQGVGIEEYHYVAGPSWRTVYEFGASIRGMAVYGLAGFKKALREFVCIQARVVTYVVYPLGSWSCVLHYNKPCCLG